jgi:hypothetical protein
MKQYLIENALPILLGACCGMLANQIIHMIKDVAVSIALILNK